MSASVVTRAIASLEEAIALCADQSFAWVIGGAEIFALALPMAHIAEVTEIDADFAGDAFAPTLNSQWKETARQAHTAAGGLAYSFVTYQNTQRGA